MKTKEEETEMQYSNAKELITLQYKRDVINDKSCVDEVVQRAWGRMQDVTPLLAKHCVRSGSAFEFMKSFYDNIRDSVMRECVWQKVVENAGLFLYNFTKIQVNWLMSEWSSVNDQKWHDSIISAVYTILVQKVTHYIKLFHPQANLNLSGTNFTHQLYMNYGFVMTCEVKDIYDSDKIEIAICMKIASSPCFMGGNHTCQFRNWSDPYYFRVKGDMLTTCDNPQTNNFSYIFNIETCDLQDDFIYNYISSHALVTHVLAYDRLMKFRKSTSKLHNSEWCPTPLEMQIFRQDLISKNLGCNANIIDYYEKPIINKCEVSTQTEENDNTNSKITICRDTETQTKRTFTNHMIAQHQQVYSKNNGLSRKRASDTKSVDNIMCDTHLTLGFSSVSCDRCWFHKRTSRVCLQNDNNSSSQIKQITNEWNAKVNLSSDRCC